MKKILFLLIFPVLCFGQTSVDFFNKGESNVNLNDFNQAIVNFTKAVELDTNFHKAFNNRGLAQANLKEFTLAIVDFTKAIELWDLDAQYYMNRGLAKAGLNDLKGSIEDYSKAIELQAIYPSTKYEKLIAYRNRGIARYESNVIGFFSDFKKACDLGDCSYYYKPEFQNLDSDTYYEGGERRRSEKNYNKAIVYYNEAIDLDSNHSIVYYNRGNAKIKLKDYYGAIADYSKAIELNPDSNALFYNYMQLNHYYNAYINRGFLKEYLKEYNEAIADYSKAIEINPNNSKAYIRRGKLKKKIGEQYYYDYKKACDLNRFDCDLYENYLKTYVFEKRNDLRTACNLGSDSACKLWYEWSNNESKSKKSSLNLSKAYTFYIDDKYRKAIKYYTKAINDKIFHFKISIFHSDFNEEALIYNDRGNCFKNLNKIKKALSDYSKYIEIVENDNRSLYYEKCRQSYKNTLRKRGDIFFKKMDFINAIKDYEKVYTLKGDVYRNTISVGRRLIKSYLAIDDYKSALLICDSSLLKIKTKSDEISKRRKELRNTYESEGLSFSDDIINNRDEVKKQELAYKFYKVICLINLSKLNEAEIILGNGIGKIKNLDDAKRFSETLCKQLKKGIQRS